MKKTIKMVMIILIILNAAYYSITASFLLWALEMENLFNIINASIWVICGILCLIVINTKLNIKL